MNHRRRLRSSTCLSAAALLCMLPQLALANPEGGVVSAGSASIATSGNTLTVNQTSNKAVIDWRGFDIGAGETTQFVQPGSTSIALNRVNSNSASRIDGNLTANGNVIIVNQNGVLFGQNAKVDVNGLVATTADIDTTKFMSSTGALAFDKAGNPNAVIANAGQITAKEAGLVGLVAPNVINSGVITAKLGRVHLASGDTATVDLYGDGLMDVAVSGAVQSQLVANSGVLSANGGTVALTAAAGKDIVNSLIAQSGALQAQSVGVKNGKIVIAAEGSNAVAGNVASNKGKKSGSSTVLVSGVVDASGYHNGERGGSISVLGDHVGILSGTFIDASGYDGGGTIKIGGDFHGAGNTPTALNTYIDSNSLIMANANSSGNGGNIAVWSDSNTWFYGNILAEGGLNSGDGGFVETSGHGYLDALGYVDLTALKGSKGTYLLDPDNIAIYGGVTPAFTGSSAGINSGESDYVGNLASSLKLWLDASDTANVQLTYNSMSTTATGTSGANTITVGSATGLQIGQRIQLGTNTSQLASVNDTSNIYTITNISGTTITLDANLAASASGATLYGGYVSQLTDKSGQGNNATQATPANMPLWISNGQNGLGVAKFDGSNDQLISSIAGSNPYSAFLTSASNTGDNGRTLSGANSSNTNWLLGGWNGEFHHAYTGNFIGGAQGSADVFAVDVAIGTNSDSTWYFNSTTQGTVAQTNNWGAQLSLGSVIGAGEYGKSSIADVIIYNTALSTNARNLVEQYQSAKWGIALTGPGVIGSQTGLTGAEAQKAMASTQAGATTDGYSVFSSDYLTRLSQTSNIILQAGNNINLDLQNTTLSLATGKNITLTAGNQILTDSAGGITTSGGNITMNAASGILFNNAFALTTGGGNINLNNAVTLGANLTTNSGSGTTTFASTVDGAHNLTATAGTFSLGGTLGGSTALGAVSLTSTNALSLPSIFASSISASTVSGNISGTGGLVTSGGNISLTAGTDVDLTAMGIITHNGNATLSGRDVYVNTSIDTGTGDFTVNASRDFFLAKNDLTTGLVSYYKFDEGSGTTATDSAGSNNGTLTNGPTYSSSNPYGIAGNDSLNFDGASDYVSANALSPITGPFTLSTWIKRTANGAYTRVGVVDVGSYSTNDGFGLWMGVNGDNVLTARINGNYGMLGTITPPLNTWANVVVVYNGTTLSTYLNGALQASTAFSNNPNPTSTVALGARVDGAYWGVASKLDDVRIYNTALSSMKISQLNAPQVSWNTGTTNINAAHNINLDLQGDVITGASNKNISLTAGNSIINVSGGAIQTTGTGKLTLTSDILNLTNFSLISAGNVTLKPYTTSGTAINVATGSSGLQITNNILGHITASSLTIGDAADTGAINVGAYNWGNSVSFLTGGTINISGAQTTSGAYDFSAAGNTLNISDGISTNGGDINLAGIMSIVQALDAGTGNVTLNDSVDNTNNGGIILNSGANLTGYDITLHSTRPVLGAQIRLNSGSAITASHSVTLQDDGSYSGIAGYAGVILNSGATVTAPTFTAQTGGSVLEYNGATLNVSGNTLLDGELHFNSNYTLPLSGTTLMGNGFNIASGVTFNTQNQDFTFNGIMTIAGTLDAGAGNITLNDSIDNSYSGGIILNSGANLTGYDITLHSTRPVLGAQIRLNSGSAITASHSVTLQDDGSYSGIAGYAGVILNSGATVTAPTFTAQTGGSVLEYNGATLNVSGNTLLDGELHFNSNYTLPLSGTTLMGNGFNIASGVTFNTQNQDFTFNGIMTIAGTLDAGAGNITLNDSIDNSYSGGIILNSGANLTGYDITLHSTRPVLGAQIRLNSGSAITASHSVTLQDDGSYSGIAGYAGVILNSGATVTAPTFTAQTGGSVLDYNGATLNVSGNTLFNNTGGGDININNALSTSNVILESDILPTFTAGVTGTSSVTLRPHSAGNSIGVLTGTNAYQITSGILNNITTPNLIIGRTNGSGAMDVAAHTWGENLQFITGSGLMSINGAQTMGAHNLTLQTDSNIAIGAAITSSGNVTINPSDTTTSIGVAGGTGALNIGTADLNNITAASITIGSLLDSGVMDVGAYSWGSNLTLLDGSGGIGINGTQVLGNHSLLAQSSTRDITIGASGGVSSSATGTPITLVAGRNFINNAGSGALSLSGGGSPRWLVYSSNPTSDTVSGQIAGGLANAFRRFSCTYGGSCPTLGSGNGLLYSYTPLLTITPSTLTAIYGNAVNLVGYAYNALTSGQYLSAGDFAVDTVTGSLTGSTTYSQGNNVGLYNINYSSGSLTSALGYGFTYANNATALNVGTRALSVTADAKNKTYGTVTDPALTYTLTSGSFYGSDGFSGALSRVAGETVVGGPYAILQNTLTAGSNYTISYSGANLNINPYTLAVTAAAKSKTYGAADPSLTYTYGTLQNGDSSAVFSGSLSRVAGETVLGGPYAIGQNTLAAGSNYNISYTGANLNIAPATLTITGDAATRLQGQPNPSFTAHYSGFQYGDTSAVVSGLQLASIADGGSLAGEYAIVPSGATAANYTFAYINGVLTVTPFAATPNTVVRTSQDPINGLFSNGGAELSGGGAWGLASRVGADSGNTGNGEGGAYINGLLGYGNAPHTSGESYASASAAIGSDRTINLRTDSSTRNASTNASPFIRWLDSMRGLLTIDPALAKRINLTQAQLNEL